MYLSLIIVQQIKYLCNLYCFPSVDDQKQLIGILGGDLNLQKLQEVINKYNTKSIYSFIVDSEGYVFAHPDKQQVNQLYNYKDKTKTVVQVDGSGKILKDDKGNEVTKTEAIQLPSEIPQMIDEAIQGKSGVMSFKDENNQRVIGSYSAIELPGY